MTIEVIDELRPLVNHRIKLNPFPHESNEFDLISVEDEKVVLRKPTNDQRLVVPRVNFVNAFAAVPGQVRSFVINAPVRWQRDSGGYGNVWAIDVLSSETRSIYNRRTGMPCNFHSNFQRTHANPQRTSRSLRD